MLNVYLSEGEKELEKRAGVHISNLRARIEEKGMKLVIDSSIRAYLINNGYSAEYGARPLKRLIQKVITDKMADKMIKGQLKHGGKAKINLSKSIEEVPEPVITISGA